LLLEDVYGNGCIQGVEQYLASECCWRKGLEAEANSQAYNKWITKLELIGRRLKNIKFAIEKEDLILHILYNPLPRLYEICQELDPCFIC